MSLLTTAARPARYLVLATTLLLGAGLSACGTGGGQSTDLTPGKPTQAPPGNLVLYVSMALGNRIDAYRLGTDGLLPSKPFSTMFVNNPRRLALSGNVLYATLLDRIVAIKLGADGTLPNTPSSSSLTREDYEPVDVEVRNGILYVASSGIGRVESYELDPDGDIPVEPSGSGVGQYPADYASLAFDGDNLYSGSREIQYIDLFTLKEDGNVPLAAELQDPQDSIALPDDIEIRNHILYVTSGSDKSIRAYRLQADGYMLGDYDTRTQTEEYYADLLLDGNLMYTAAYNAGRIDVYNVQPNGMFEEVGPIFRTQQDPAAYPSRLIQNGGILYVAQAGLNRVDAYVLDGNGLPPTFPTSSTKAAPVDSLPLDMVLHELN